MSVNDSNELKEKKRLGRKPMTPEKKAAAAKVRAAEKAMADNLRPEIFIQFQGEQTNMSTLLEAAKVDFRSTKKRIRITGLMLYVKPEEHTAYYVINEKYDGKISF